MNWDRIRELKTAILLGGSLYLAPAIALADTESEVAQLREQLKTIEKRLEALTADKTPVADTKSAPVEPTPQAPKLRLLDVSLDGLFAAGWSDADAETLGNLQAGGHDPKKRGFTVQNVELSLTGAVDPYLTGETHIVFQLDPDEGETLIELEEAFVTTQTLPYGLQLEAGQFFTEFGLTNPKHPHSWSWVDQPVVNSRIFGPDGMRAPGARLGWLTPLPWYSQIHFGAQNANGETVVSFLGNDEVFEERPVGGSLVDERPVKHLDDLVYLARLENFWELNEEVSAKFGVSGLFGPNPTSSDADTYIYGADLKVKWLPSDNFRGWPFVSWESEYIQRDYDTSPFTPEDGADLVGGDTLTDQGFYTQLLWGFRPSWAVGARFEHAFASGDAAIDDKIDPLRDARYRFSPLLAWHPSEFSRLRLQYNYDDAEHLESSDAHSFWLSWEFLYGAHPAHQY